MRLRVLGCHGGESPSHRASCFLIDEGLLLDAGACTRGLTVAEQAKLDWVFISHAHMDHIRDLPLLADNVIGVRTKPVDIYCTRPTADAIMKNIMNNSVWPDFTKIPNPADPEKRPTLRLNVVESGQTVEVGDYKVRTVPVTHTVDTQALFVTSAAGTIVYSSDTGPTDKLYEEVNALSDLRAFILETSFTNDMEGLAKVSGHLTPAMLAVELRKYKPKSPAPVLIYHLKPSVYDAVKAQLLELNDPRLHILRVMDEFNY